MGGTETEDLYRKAGLEVHGRYGGAEGPTVEEAFRVVVNIETEPSMKISRRTGDAAEAVGRMWLHRALERGLFGSEGEFLVAGGLTDGWIRVRITPATDISRLIQNDGNIQLLARSVGGDKISAIDVEGDYFWLVDEPYPNQAIG
ncbi:hypothetical protein DWB77_03221 [Streptomyces hundungensis]|uniref:BRCT domain-containing protein n=1 Tax=Streptomyces hundungensis TaxID=1077946 RepID=A0A387HFL7_9ACTN|nr:hypothetical protein [Streptomyces hundungensis]AYG81083.1 hypothetical protein DWB77_03221 [Streptomyces hundungensis]